MLTTWGESMESQVKKKILAIDGGGIKGLFAVHVLVELEEQINDRIYKYFDMISGTSTGAIIAAGLALGMPAKIIRDLYLKYAEEIFPQDKKILRELRRFVASKYRSKGLRTVLEKAFKDHKIGDCKTRLLIPSYNLVTRGVQVFKTSHASDLYMDYKEKIVDVLLSTTAAPTYFAPHRWKNGAYIDGGIGANNPAFLALVEGISYRCGWNKEDIYLLSLGCMEDDASATTGREKMGFLCVPKIISLFMEAESQYSQNICKILLGEERYLRVNAEGSRGQASLDRITPDSLNFLETMGVHAAQVHMERIKTMFLDEKADVLHPCHK